MADVNNITQYAFELLTRKKYQIYRLQEELEDAEATLEFAFSSRVEDAIEEQIENIKEDIEDTKALIAKLESIIESGFDPVTHVSVEKYDTVQEDCFIARICVSHQSHDFTWYFIAEETYNAIQGYLKLHHNGIGKQWLLPDWDKLDIATETVDITKVNRK